MPADTVLMLLIAAAVGAGLPYLAWRRAAARVRELEARLLPQLSEDARLDQLSAAVDAIGRHVEQLAEHQDFLSRVLTERLPAAGHRLAPHEPEITPH